MSEKLTPKPVEKKLYTWKDLDDFLQMMFTSGSNNIVILTPEDYAIPKEELISELRNNNYSVLEENGKLKIT